MYSTFHYTNIPFNPNNLALPEPPEVDVVWAINQAKSVLYSPKAKNVEKARQLAFLMHFVGDIHQPLHSTTMYTNKQPGGTLGGNLFYLDGKWRNLHSMWGRWLWLFE